MVLELTNRKLRVRNAPNSSLSSVMRSKKFLTARQNPPPFCIYRFASEPDKQWLAIFRINCWGIHRYAKHLLLCLFPLKYQRDLIAPLVFMPCTIAVETSYVIIQHTSLVFKELKGFSFYLIHVFVTLVVVVQIHTTKWAERDEHRWCIKCKCIIPHRHNETNVRSLMSGSTQGGYVVILHHAVFCQAGRR